MQNIFAHTILHTSVNISAYSDNHIMTCSCLNLETIEKHSVWFEKLQTSAVIGV